MGQFLTVTYTWARRCAIALIGGSVVLIGVLMIVLPGPALVVIPAGLAILGIEFAFARRWLRQLRTTGTKMFGKTMVWLRPRSKAASARGSFDEPAQRAVSSRADVVHATVKPRANTRTDYYRIP